MKLSDLIHGLESYKGLLGDIDIYLTGEGLHFPLEFTKFHFVKMGDKMTLWIGD